MPFRNLRDFLELLEKKDKLLRIKAEVDWNEEIGAIAEQALMREGSALLFENIKDYKDTRCTKVAIGYWMSRKRMALALDLPEDMPPLEIQKVWRQRVKNPIKLS